MKALLESLDGIFIGTLSLSKLFAAVIVLLICIIVKHIVLKIISRALERSTLDGAVKSFIRSISGVIMWFITIIITADSLGIPVTSLVAVLSVAGLALSLSVQSILSNLFSGITILSAKPFGAGDFVELGASSGTVSKVGLFYTTLTTADNKVVSIPNSDIASSQIINYSAMDTRRIELAFTLSYESDARAVIEALIRLAGSDGRVLTEPAAFAALSEYGKSSVKYILRIWVKSADYWPVSFDLNLKARPALEAIGAGMRYDHLNVHIVSGSE